MSVYSEVYGDNDDPRVKLDNRNVYKHYITGHWGKDGTLIHAWFKHKQ